MPNSLPPTPPRSPSPARPLDIDSIFGSDDDELQPESNSRDERPRRDQQSNLPAVRRQFLAAGYREGLDRGRNDPLQAQRGFDEGYRVGAALGMRVGLLRGMANVSKGASGDLSKATASLSLEALVTDLQARNLLDREPGAEQLVGDDDVFADDDDHSEFKKKEEEQMEPDWRLPSEFVDDIASIRHATTLAQTSYSEHFGTVDARPLVEQG